VIKPLRLVVTDTAKADLREMYDYIHADNPEVADAFIEDLTDKLFSLAENGITGLPRDWISSGLRTFPYRECCFYFRIVDDAMMVVRVLHGRQDVNVQEFPFD
jgi:toxin ParE1/3/4